MWKKENKDVEEMLQKHLMIVVKGFLRLFIELGK